MTRFEKAVRFFERGMSVNTSSMETELLLSDVSTEPVNKKSPVASMILTATQEMGM